MKKQLWKVTCLSFGMIVLILDSKTAIYGMQEGIELCLKAVIPSLFPFILISNLMTSYLIGTSIPILRPIGQFMGIPQGAESMLIAAFLGGYPVGAKTVAQVYQNGTIPKEDAERLLTFCNNAGPSFLFGMLGTVFTNIWMPWALWIIHITSAVLVSRIFPFHSSSVQISQKNHVSVTEEMQSALKIMGQICGWVVLFRVILSFLRRWVLWIFATEIQILLTGMLELSNGCIELSSVANPNLQFIIASCLLGFGGLCVTMQTMSVINSLSIGRYILGKVLQTGFSLLLSCILLFRLWAIIPILFLFFLLFQQKGKIVVAIQKPFVYNRNQ